MHKKAKKNGFWQSPLALVILVVIMLAMILAIVVFSARKEAEIAERKAEEAGQTQSSQSEEVKPTSPPSEEEVIITEDGDAPVRITAQGTYENSSVLSTSTGFSMTLSLGIELPDVTDAIYLNPHFVYEYAGNPDEMYCYLLKAERVPLEYANNDPGPAMSTANIGITDFAILGRTYDKVVPAECRNSAQYGVRWRDNSGLGGQEHDGDSIHILVIRISDGTLMGAAKASIVYDKASKSYKLASLENTDVKYTGELTTAQRDQLIQDARAYLLEGNPKMTFGVNEEELDSQMPFVVVERPGKPYYNKLFDKNGNVIPRGSISNSKVFAVNINYGGIGFYTVYFAPEAQAHGFTVEKLNEDEELKLVIIGYDAFAPITVDTFNSYLYPDDVASFGASNY